MTEKKKYLQWHAEETKKGLSDVKFLTDETVKGISEEEFYREANLINQLHADGKAVERPDVF